MFATKTRQLVCSSSTSTEILTKHIDGCISA